MFAQNGYNFPASDGKLTVSVDNCTAYPGYGYYYPYPVYQPAADKHATAFKVAKALMANGDIKIETAPQLIALIETLVEAL